LSTKLEQLHRTHTKLEGELQSIERKARTLRNEVKMLKERLAIKQVEEQLGIRELPTLCGEKTANAPIDFLGEPETQETECMTEPVTLELLRETEILSDTEGKHIFHLAGICIRD
jgi:hypothetical protein